MNIDAASLSALSQAKVEGEVQVRVARKTMDAQKEQGEAALQLLEGAKELAKQTGTGGSIDVNA